MPRTTFDPRVHGFAFGNTWALDEAEQQHLSNYFAASLTRRNSPGPVGGFLTSLGMRALRNPLESHLAPGYGLCGGMCFLALDFYKAGLPVPRGRDANDQPAPGTHLRHYIWKRQIDSIVSDGARFLAWLFFLNYVPPAWPFRGRTAWLLARSKEEWKTLKASVDVGAPVPIGLVRDAKNVYENHQVLAIGYDEADEAHGRIYLYDPNCPGQVSTISIEFGEQLLDGQETCGAIAPLRGFFCESYTFSDPVAAIIE
ncbi:MAG: hypothetical protein SWK90_11145 [Chloroflexota bacterium]|nr:hypothetical protein [Chloroflexota bacterium]